MTTAVAGSMIGEIGALGGGFIPNAMGQSKQHLDTYLWGFVAFAGLALLLLLMLRQVQIRWTRTWAEKGGRARVSDASSTTQEGQRHGDFGPAGASFGAAGAGSSGPRWQITPIEVGTAASKSASG